MTVLSTRLPNSSIPWNDAGATIDVAVQRGQVSQPRPESVSRTAAPLTTTSPIAMAANTAIRRKAVGETVGRLIARPSLEVSRVLTSVDAAGGVTECRPQRQPVDRAKDDQRRARVDVAHGHVGVRLVDPADELRLHAVEVAHPGEKVRSVDGTDLRCRDDDVRPVVDYAGESRIGVGVEKDVGGRDETLDLRRELAPVAQAGLGNDDSHVLILSCCQSQRKVRAAIAMLPAAQTSNVIQSCSGT